MHPSQLRLQMTAWWLPLVALAALLANASAQTANPFLESSPGTVRQVSLAKTIEQDADRNLTSGQTQLTVSIEYLLVDEPTRRAIYQLLDQKSIRHSSYEPNEGQDRNWTEVTTTDRVDKRFTSFGHATTCRLSSSAADKILDLVGETATCWSSKAPSLILQQNQAAEVNDTVARRIVVDVRQEREQIKPIIRVIEEGTRMRILARLNESSELTEAIELMVQLIDKRIVKWNSIEVYGLGETATTLQHPICEWTTVTTANSLAETDCLLMDPHVTRATKIEVAPTSMFSKLPLVGKRFSTIETKSVENHWMVLVKPSIFSPP